MNHISHDWEEQQIRGFTSLCKNYLAKRHISFDSIKNDFQDGIKLISFIEIISKSKIDQTGHADPISPYQEIENISFAINFLEEKGVKLTNIGAKDIYDGNITLICGLIFSCIQKFQIDKIEENNKKSTEALLIWCKNNTSKYNVNITDFNQSWQNGLAFCALIHNFHPELFNFNALTQRNSYKNWQTFIQACTTLGISVCYQIGDTGCQSTELIILQINEIYYFINITEKTHTLDVLIEIMRKLSEFPYITTLSKKFNDTYQKNVEMVHDLQQRCIRKDPTVSSAIPTLKEKINKDIRDEINQLEDYVRSLCNTSVSNKEKFTKIKEATENLREYNEYFPDCAQCFTSIINMIIARISNLNKNDETTRRKNSISEYKILYDQLSQYLDALKNKFKSKSDKYTSSELTLILDEANQKMKQLENKNDELTSKNIEINEFEYNYYILLSSFYFVLQEIEKARDSAEEREKKISSYIQLCDTKLSNLTQFQTQFLISKKDRSKLNSLNINISDEISNLAAIDSSFSELGNNQSFVDSKYHPQNILDQFVSLSNKVKKTIEQIDFNNLNANTNTNQKHQINLINNSIPNIFEKDQTSKIVNHILNLKPTNNNYPSNMTKVQENYWESPSIYDSPLYSDIHPPIRCSSQEERNKLLHNMYKVPPHLQNDLGGERAIAAYSDKVSLSLNDRGIVIRSPFDLGFQRNQDPDSLYNLVKTDQIEIMQTGLSRFSNISNALFYIKIKNISGRRINFNFQKGSVVDFPVDKQQVYIAETISGTLNINEIKEYHLRWFCMYEGKSLPDEGAKLTPFIFVAPEKYCQTLDHRIWTPNNKTWWNNLQPEKSGKKSSTNTLWTYLDIEERHRRKTTVTLDHKIEIGGKIDGKLFKILLQRKSLAVSLIEGVVRYQYMSKKEYANEMMIYNNQMGFVITLGGNNQHVLIEKTESDKWEGGLCQYNRNNDWYSYNDHIYYKDFSSIAQKGFTVDKVISGMKSDPKYFDSATYNSQHSTKHVFGTLGIKIPLIHTGQIIIPSIHNLIDF